MDEKHPVYKAGFQEVVITGPIGTTALAGYGGLQKHAQGINDDLKATAAVIQAGEETVALVSLDLAGLLPGTVQEIKNLATSLVNDAIPGDHILIACTHTHSAPDTLGIFQPGRNLQYLPDEEYLAMLKRQVAGSILGAWNKLEEVQLVAGSGMLHDATANRRAKLPSNPLHERTIDPELQVIACKGYRGIIGIVVNFTAHGTSFPTRQTFLQSADYVGAMRDEVDRQLGMHVPCVYLNGACGDIAPRPFHIEPGLPTITIKRDAQENRIRLKDFNTVAKELGRDAESFKDFYKAISGNKKAPRFHGKHARISFDDGDLVLEFETHDEGSGNSAGRGEVPKLQALRRLVLSFLLWKGGEPAHVKTGKKIAGKVIEVLNASREFKEPHFVKALSRRIRLDIDDEEMANEGLFEDMISVEEGEYHIYIEIQVIRIGNAMILTIPGEAVSQVQLRLKKLVREQAGFDHVIVSAITNGEIGYILTPEEYDLAGYELMICFGRENAYHIEKGLVELASEISGVRMSWDAGIELPVFDDRGSLFIEDLIRISD